MKPPVEAPTSSARRPATSSLQRVEGVGELDRRRARRTAAGRRRRARSRRRRAARASPPAGVPGRGGPGRRSRRPPRACGTRTGRAPPAGSPGARGARPERYRSALKPPAPAADGLADASRPRLCPRAARAPRDRFGAVHAPPARLRGADGLDLARRPADLRRAHRRSGRQRRRARVRQRRGRRQRPARPAPKEPGSTRPPRPRVDGLQVWSVPANSVLRQRPGHYYWQAYLTGEAANGAEEPIGPVAGADRHGCRWPTAAAASCSRASAGAAQQELLPLLRRLPRFGRRRALQEARQAAGFALGPEGAALDERQGRASRTASASPASRRTSPRGVLGVQTDYVKRGKVVESDLALRADESWAQGPDYPALDEVDLESVLLHELGHMAGNKKHRSRCTNTPMIEALGAGEWWRGCARQVVRRLREQRPRGLGAQAARAPRRAHGLAPQASPPSSR